MNSEKLTTKKQPLATSTRQNKSSGPKIYPSAAACIKWGYSKQSTFTVLEKSDFLT